MNKRMQELMGLIDARQKAAQESLAAGDLDAAQKALDEGDALRREYDLTERAYAARKAEALEAMAGRDEGAARSEKAAGRDSVKAFGAAVKERVKAFAGLSEGTASAGGLTVPQDVSTRVEQLRQAEASLLDLVRVTPTATKSGTRVFQKRASHAGYAQVAEGAALAVATPPEFASYSYEIKKYGGFYPVTEELLEDSDENVSAILTEWMAAESRATANALVLAVLNAKAAKAATSVDDIKKAYNVTLGQAFAASSKVVTNDDGLNWLDCLRDSQGRPLLSENAADPLKPLLALGFRKVPLVVLPNSVLASSGSKVPFVVGDLREGVEYFDRRHRTVLASNTASAGDYNAFANDLTLLRAIEREDCVQRDGDAWVRLELDTASASTASASGSKA